MIIIGLIKHKSHIRFSDLIAQVREITQVIAS